MADSNDSEIKHGPLMLEGPKAKAESAGADAPIIDLEAVHTPGADERIAAEETTETVPPDQVSHWHLPTYAPLAAGLVFAIVLGAIAGAAATSSLLSNPTPSASTAAANANSTLQDSVAQLSSELSTLKASIATAQRSSTAQFGKLSERLDRADKAQAEPAAKLAKIQESLDKLDRRQVAAVAAPEVTGSVTPKEETKPQVAEGWRLRDFYSGRAVVENKNGTLFEVAPGSNLPGLGKVETIKRENGKVVVTTQKGIIAASLEPRRPVYQNPYRY